ncbi:uncharacterized protein LOC144743402 [Ciona intestinalis]
MKIMTITLIIMISQLRAVFSRYCYSGKLSRNFNYQHRIPCNFDKNSCFTKIEINHGQRIVHHGCKDTKACVNNAYNNPAQCYSLISKINKVRICHSCCQADYCNKKIITSPPSQPTTTPTVTSETVAPRRTPPITTWRPLPNELP